MEEIIRIEQLTKRFHKNILFEAVDLSIYKGQSIVFTGKNGSGKSTMLKMIAGLTSLSSGKVHRSQELLIHYIPEHFPRKKMSAYQYLLAMGKIDGCPIFELKNRIQDLAEDFYMSEMLHTPLSFLSKGTLQKIGVIQALLRTPDILLLDEPLSGQDERSQKVFITKMKSLLEERVTIIMSCHEKHLIRAISDTAYQIENRKILPTAMSTFDSEAVFHLVFIDEQGKAVLPDVAFSIERFDNQVRLSVPASQTNLLIRQMLDNHWTLRGMQDENSD
ncbi:ABC transporter ATP-binding protein [Enterococcus sp. BWM-S5]|uniref:ABC transporter ATP-binding protein n=1 Tax=Enterococcus larvae TaxID=2794352 RepID=A0ABS4CEP0_9ENTE|nr:ABC transporter ATP-binding protein [Enterococcus larvae]